MELVMAMAKGKKTPPELKYTVIANSNLKD